MAFKIALAVVVFCVLICRGNCINCFECNSANNSACLDMSLYDGETLARIIPVVDCSRTGPLTTTEQINFFCRKLTQTIYNADRSRSDVVRVTRTCGWIRDDRHKPCLTIHGSDHIDTSCECYHDRCNSADSADPTTATILFVVFSAVLYYYR